MPSRETLVAAKAVLLLVMGIVLAVAMVRMRRAKQAQDRLIDGLDPASSTSWFRVVVSRAGPFARRLKVLGYEARGVLVNGTDSVRVLAELPSGERLDRTWRKDALGLQWVGNRGLGSANMHWLSLGKGEGELRIAADTGVNALASREATTDIIRMIAPGFALPDVARNEFALEKNPVTLAGVALLLAALVFAIVDGVILNRLELLEPERALIGLPVVLLVAVPFYLWQAARAVPSREALVLSLLLGGALAFAYLPTIKRIDQALAGGGAMHAYRHVGGGILHPVEPGLPTIDHSRYVEYWTGVDGGPTHDFRLVRGPLRLWQLDRRGLEERMRAWYQAHPRKRR